MPVTKIMPKPDSIAPSSCAPGRPDEAESALRRWAPPPGSWAPKLPPAGSSARSVANVRIAVITTGISMETAATSTAEPTVAAGLYRMILNAAS